METIGIRTRIQEKEERLRIRKDNRQLEKRCSVHIQQKLAASKKYCFKRQNSFNRTLDPQLDIDDMHAHDWHIKQMRASFQIVRGQANRAL